MAGGFAVTEPVQAVLEALLGQQSGADRAHHAADLLTASGLTAGMLYSVLARLEAVRWLESGWEAPTRQVQGWPRRRYYRLSSDGVALARGALASLRSAARAPATSRLRAVGEAT